MKAMFALAGFLLDSTGEEALAAVDHPLADALRRYRAAARRAGTYGRNWLGFIGDDERIRCSWKQTGAKTGRMASGNPNLQNLPKDPAYRKCFVAPPGRVLIRADYSQIELRIAAKIAGERHMIDAFREGADLHTLTARQLVGREVVTSEERGLAKPVNFGLIYGLGAAALARKAKIEFGVEMSQKQAEEYRATWFAAWPGIPRWHRELRSRRWQQMLSTEPAETRTLTGRRTIVNKELWHGARANFIVQGTGGDGIKQALALLWERREQCPHAIPVLAVHDEIVIEADMDRAEQAADWLRAAMVDAMQPLIKPVPVDVELTTARTWGGDAPEPQEERRSVIAVHFSSASCEWATPPELFAELDREFHFTLDVCATAENAKCENYFTMAEDGLAQTWTGRVWMNPPYGHVIGQWMAKAYASVVSGQAELVVCLVPARVDTNWWHDYAAKGDVRFLKGRLKFGGAKSGAPFPSAVVVFRRPENGPLNP
jgi:phage N-6-adenine-methyltransferase